MVRTHGTRSSEARASASCSVKKVPLISSRMIACRCAGLVRMREPSMRTARIANIGWRTIHAMPPHVSKASASAVSASETILSCRGLSHMRAPQDVDAKLRKREPRLSRRHGHEAMARHAGRCVDFEERPSTIALKDEVEPSPATAPHEAKRVQGLRLDGRFGFGWQTAGTKVLGLIGKVFVVVIVVALWRLDSNQRQRPFIDD